MPLRLFEGLLETSISDPAARRNFIYLNRFLRDLGGSVATLEAAGGGGGGGGLPDEPYVTISNTANLTAERALAVTAPITISDGGPNSTVNLGASLAVPGIILGTAAAAGSAGSLIRSDATIAAFDVTVPADLASAAATGSIAFAARRDHVHVFPPTLQTGTPSTLTLTDDGSFQTLTGNLGTLKFTVPGLAGSTGFRFTSTGTTTNVVTIDGDPDNSNATLIRAEWAGGVITSSSVRCWDARPVSTGVWTGATILGFDTSSFTLTGTAGSDTTNKAYCARLSGPAINANNAGYTDIAALLIEGPRRITGTPTITTAEGISLECPTVSPTQIGLLIKQRTAQETATDRIGIDILTHNSGTNRWGLRTADRAEIQSQSAQAQTALLLRQLATGAAAGAHLNLDDKAGNPPTPNAGDLWRNGTSLNYRKDGSTTVDLLAAAGGGDNISVNGTAATDADFDDATPAAPTGIGGGGVFEYMNVLWQKDALSPNNISAYFGKDRNGNSLLGFLPTASAVNFVAFESQATGVGPRIHATGSDTNVDLRLTGRGTTGRVMLSPPGAGESEVISRSHFVPFAALAFSGCMG